MHINYWGAVKGSTVGRVGGGLLLAALAAGAAAPLWPHAPEAFSQAVLQPPSAAHWLGTNDVGQDVMAQLLHGARRSLAVALAAGCLTTALSFLTGAGAVLGGRRVDAMLMRLTDAMLAVPTIVIVIVLAAYVPLRFAGLVLVIALTGWAAGARIVRAQVLILREKAHVLAARTFGASTRHLLFRHLLPDIAPVLLVSFIQSARRAVLLEAGLAFLGVGDPTAVSWGMMLQQALQFYYTPAWSWWLLPPGIALALTLLSFLLLGSVLEPLLDPRLRRDEHAGD
ncbi:MAG: ABC transporter permease [Thermoanaerobacterales bacterium]|nr:ABC transporter permease [Thermoanaerobacterales bacterium]